MFNRKEINRWWKTQKTSIQVSIIAGIFGLLVAFVGCIGGIIPVVINYYLDNVPFEISKYKLLQNSYIQWEASPTLSTDVNGQEYSLLPMKCFMIEGIDPNEVYGEEIKINNQHKSFGFDLLTDKPLVITNGVVRLLSYEKPISESSISNLNLYLPGGAGGVPVYNFPESNVNNSTKQIIVGLKVGSLQLNPGDAVTLVFNLAFPNPGAYKLVFLVEGQLGLSQQVEFTSRPYTYAWQYINDPMKFPIRDTFMLTNLKWAGECP